MSKLRPECGVGRGPALPDDTALFLIRDSVERRRELIYGRLDDRHGGHCAMGAFWEDNPRAVVNSRVVDEVATVNDSIPEAATPKERWTKVRNWLRWKVRILALKTNPAPSKG